MVFHIWSPYKLKIDYGVHRAGIPRAQTYPVQLLGDVVVGAHTKVVAKAKVLDVADAPDSFAMVVLYNNLRKCLTGSRIQITYTCGNSMCS